MNWFSKVFRFRPAVRRSEGFVYVSNEEDGPMKAARKGRVVSVTGRGPPWIVVNHDLESVLVAKWPGRLWRVGIVEAATARDQAEVGGAPLPYAGYTRSISVRILGEVSPDVLFGPHGKDVAAVLHKAGQLDRPLAEALSSNRHADARPAYDRVWRGWLKERAIPDDLHPDLDDTLMLGGVVSGSPINAGLLVLDRVVFERAKALEGAAAIQQDDEDVWLVPPWSGAVSALCDAALAFGAPELVTEPDRTTLLQAWRHVFG